MEQALRLTASLRLAVSNGRWRPESALWYEKLASHNVQTSWAIAGPRIGQGATITAHGVSAMDGADRPHKTILRGFLRVENRHYSGMLITIVN